MIPTMIICPSPHTTFLTTLNQWGTMMITMQMDIPTDFPYDDHYADYTEDAVSMITPMHRHRLL